MGYDEFTRAYVQCALWESTDDDGEPLDRVYDWDDIEDGSLGRMVRDCVRFQADNAELIGSSSVRYGPDCTSRESRAGHDFWLTRNRAGAGFWDGDWVPESSAAALTVAAHGFGETALYVGDDGRLYLW
jgi:hypothetical protein